MKQTARHTASNSIVTVLYVKGGWTTIVFENGIERKVRNSEITAMPQTEKESKVEEVKQKETEVVKIGKIKNTQFRLDRYVKTGVKTVTGRLTVDCDDDTAEALRGMPIDEVYAFASETIGVGVEELKAKYGHLNAGMQRMNLGNKVRGALRKAAAAVMNTTGE